MTSFTLDRETKRVAQDPFEQPEPRVCTVRVSEKSFGIQWQHRGAEASESNLNLVFKDMS